jgi:GNAT superfamily N-acetyltransferase
MMNAVGFSSPPSWLKPFHTLSNGQKFRAELARCLLANESGIVFDEFTSVVDRDVAKIGCAAVENMIRRNKRTPPFVAVSCHYDIIDWLQPDWVFDAGTQVFEWRARRRRPEIRIEICKTTTAAWDAFREHHYLDHNINRSSACFLATWDEKFVAFSSVLHFPHPKCSNFKREHRTVVLPDFQGVGIGNRLSEFIARHYTTQGFRFISTTSAPSMIKHRSKSPNWRTHRFGRSSIAGKTTNTLSKTIRNSCISASFEYIGKS